MLRSTAAVAAATLLLSGCATRWDKRPPSSAYGGGARPMAVPLAGPWNGAQPQPWGPPAHGPEPGVVPRLDSRWIPAGAACLAELGRLGVAHERLDSLKGVDTPVHVTGPVAGVRFVAGAGLPLDCDCRLAVALAWTAPHLIELGVREVRFSGAYVDRRMRSGRPSRHARGLAIDLHAMTFDDGRHEVKQAFSRGLAGGCAADAPALNRVVCRVRQLGLFKELLTPDSDRDHHDHFHLAIAPLD